MSELVTALRADRRRFSLHPEREVVEVTRHRRQIEYIETNLRTQLPDRFVGGNLGVYWVPGQRREPWVGPDVLVSERPLEDPKPRVYLVWEDGPIRFVAEVASRRTRRTERKKRQENYQRDLQVPEYLYLDLDREQLELLRLREGTYHPVAEEGERFYSQELGLYFGWNPERDFVRIWTADGLLLPTWEEIQEQRDEAERRALEAEARAEELRESEARARGRVREAEARAAELAAEVERLRRAAGGDASGGRSGEES